MKRTTTTREYQDGELAREVVEVEEDGPVPLRPVCDCPCRSWSWWPGWPGPLKVTWHDSISTAAAPRVQGQWWTTTVADTAGTAALPAGVGG